MTGEDERAREQVSALGDFFVLDPVESHATGWRPVSDLVVGTGLRERVETTAAALGRLVSGTVEPRVAASTASLGLFARLLSPALGAALLDVPGPAPAGLQWRHAPTGPLPLRATARSDDALAESLTCVVEPLATRLEDEHGLARAVVRGNAASAVMGSLRMAVAARRDLAGAADRVATKLFATTFLAGTALPGSPFVRRSCCLYYRLPGGGYCGDCVLAPAHRDRVAADQQG